MTILYVRGNIFDAKTDAIVNTVNCKGVMGKGLALEFKKKYPKMYNEYKIECEKGELKIGIIHLYKVDRSEELVPDEHYFKYILNFPTKDDWRFKSKLEYIEKGLKYFRRHHKKYLSKGIESIAFPRLGCQQGGLDWDEVKPLIEKYLKDLSLETYIYSYESKREKETENAKEQLTLTATKLSATKIGSIRPNSKKLVVEGVITKFHNPVETRKGIVTEVILEDDTGSITLEIWGGQKNDHVTIKEGDRIRIINVNVYGDRLRLSRDYGGDLIILH